MLCQMVNALPAYLLYRVCHASVRSCWHIDQPRAMFGRKGFNRFCQWGLCCSGVGDPGAEGGAVRGVCKAGPLLLGKGSSRVPRLAHIASAC